ncbi:uncharacterized protein [Macrobrachium rosenbergii]|uniref:uncharacterized protein n=1 Tax=Macrobrachium rosenbergii TaxID=79674 RepID=UPI0034D75286
MGSNKICHTLSAPYHPQSNGLAERAVQVFKRLFIKFSSGDISLRLSRLLYHYRCTIHSSTGRSPAELLFGRAFRSALDHLRPPLTSPEKAKNSQFKSKFLVGDAIFFKNFGVGAEWLLGSVAEVINAKNFKVKLACSDNVICKRHISQMFHRQIPVPPADSAGAINDDKNVPVLSQSLPPPAVSSNVPADQNVSPQNIPITPIKDTNNAGECPHTEIAMSPSNPSDLDLCTPCIPKNTHKR